MPLAFLIVSIIGLAFTANAFRPIRIEPFSIFSFFAGWLTSELPLHHFAWQAIATAVFIGFGALHTWEGWLGLGLTIVSWLGLAVLVRRGLAAGAIVDAALARDLGVTESPAPSARQWARMAFPFRLHDSSIECLKDIPYLDGAGKRQRLDIHRRKDTPVDAPVLFYIHGGGWVIGDKREQGLPMMQQLAADGWVCVTVNYRLSPKVAFPEHLLDCKRALAWVKGNITSYGGDPGRIAVSGGSAGGHLAALVALTAGRADLQPGFEDVDLSVQAAVPFYGQYDFRNRDKLHSRRHDRFFDRTIMRTTPAANPDLYLLASPMDQVRADAPPFFILHGSNDTLIPVGEARRFVELLRAVSQQPVVYAELPGTQHAFEVFRSIRALEVVPRVEVFLDHVLATARSS